MKVMPAKSLSEIKMRQFRSYENVTVKLSAITFIVGRNAAGKSNLLDFLGFMSELASEPLVTVLDRRGGISAVRRRVGRRGAPSEVFLNLEIRDSDGGAGFYALWLKGAKGKGFKVDAENLLIDSENPLNGESNRSFDVQRKGAAIDSSIGGFSPKLSDEALFLPLSGGLKGSEQFVSALANIKIYSIDPLRMKESQIPDDGSSLRRDGSNAASVIREMRKTHVWPKVLEFLKAAVPQIEDVEAKSEGARLSLQFRQRNSEGDSVHFPGFQASDGTLRILGILLALLQQPSPTLVALEEPEANVHPGALGVLLDAIQYASATTQIVVTTQSPELLDADWIRPEDIRLVEWKDGASIVSDLNAGTVEVLNKHLRTPGELMRSGALEALV